MFSINSIQNGRWDLTIIGRLFSTFPTALLISTCLRFGPRLHRHTIYMQPLSKTRAAAYTVASTGTLCATATGRSPTRAVFSTQNWAVSTITTPPFKLGCRECVVTSRTKVETHSLARPTLDAIIIGITIRLTRDNMVLTGINTGIPMPKLSVFEHAMSLATPLRVRDLLLQCTNPTPPEVPQPLR